MEIKSGLIFYLDRTSAFTQSFFSCSSIFFSDVWIKKA